MTTIDWLQFKLWLWWVRLRAKRQAKRYAVMFPTLPHSDFVPPAAPRELQPVHGLRPTWVFRADGAHRRYAAWFSSPDPTPIVGMAFDDGSFTGTVPFKPASSLMIVER